MRELVEIRWHARAGQGAVTASKLLAETALMQGQYIQAMPEYGPERTGAPLKAYTRVSDSSIELHNNIVTPDIVVILDDTLLSFVDVLEGIRDGGTVIINTRMDADEVRSILSAPSSLKIATVDASGIALRTIKRDIPNTPIVGVLAEVTKVVPVDALRQNLIHTFSKKFAQEVIDANLASVDEAIKEVKVA
ncbi:MAG: 2-oxoacid:acceptor oxidoreductase family protein [Coriobacteriales bacterium]|jgi:pyruvate ferredoxin oxidoreductase gamma subunit|nr:2-oxoacid:acceptor oxidoreductase family protein [Coriobacteriales bacterium]